MRMFKKMPMRLGLILTLFLMASFLTACGSSLEGGKQGDNEHITIGVINFTRALDPVVDGFKSQMAELGYIEGENVTYIYDGPPDSIEGLDSIAQSLVEADVDLILSVTTPATLAAKRATVEKQIPIVFGPLQDPIGSGVVTNLTAPGENLTGLMFGQAEGKRLEWLTQIAPDINRVYIPYNIDDPAVVAALELVSEAAETLDVELVLAPVHNVEEAAAAFENVPDDVDAIMALPDGLLGQFNEVLRDTAIEHKLPFTVPLCDGVYNGTLMAYGAETQAAGVQAARLADSILKGTAPADLPVETTEFFLALNLETAEAIGLEIPDSILNQANIIVYADE